MTDKSDSCARLEWELLGEETLHDGWRKVLRRRYRYPDGTVEDWEIKGDPRIVSIFCLTPGQRVVLVRQFRAGPNRCMLELPAGIVGKGEEPAEAAAREMLEETGWTGELELASAHFTDSYSTQLRHVFIIREGRKVADARPDPGEFLEVVEVSLAEFRRLLRSAQMTDIDAGYLALDYLHLL